MKHRILALCALFAGFGAMSHAQASGSFSITCSPDTVSEQISANWVIATFPCTTTANINGVPFKGLTFSSTGQFGPTETNVCGVIVGSLTSGDQVFFEYHTVLPVRNGVAGIGTLTYKIVGGTGIANGITGSGNCKVGAPGSAESCAGTYATR